MTDIIEIPNLEITLRSIKNSDKLPTLTDKLNWNFDQFLNLYNKLKFITTVTGNRGIPGATGRGEQGEQGTRGSKIIFENRVIQDTDPVTNPDLNIDDVVIDSQGNYFTIIENNGLKYSFSFNVASASAEIYLLTWTQFQSISNKPIIQRFGINSGTPTDFLLLMGRRTNNDDNAEFYKLAVGLENNSTSIPSSLTVCNIIDDVDGNTQSAPDNFFNIAFKYRKQSNLLPSSFTSGIQYTQEADDIPVLKIKNVIGELNILSNSNDPNLSYISHNTPRTIFWGYDPLQTQSTYFEINVNSNDNIKLLSSKSTDIIGTGTLSTFGYSVMSLHDVQEFNYNNLSTLRFNNIPNVSIEADTINHNYTANFNKTANFTQGTGTIPNVGSNNFGIELNGDGNYFEVGTLSSNSVKNIVSISLLSALTGTIIWVKVGSTGSGNLRITKNIASTNYIIGAQDTLYDEIEGSGSFVLRFVRVKDPSNNADCWWYLGRESENQYIGTKIVNNITERNNLSRWNGRTVHVIDASADLGHTGYAGYMWGGAGWIIQYDSKFGGTKVVNDIATRNSLVVWDGRTVHVLNAISDIGYAGYAGYVYNPTYGWIIQYKQVQPEDNTLIGAIDAYAGDNDPNGKWLICNGRSLSRFTYSDLFSLIGTRFGATSATTFNLPDFRGRSPIGAGSLFAGWGGAFNVGTIDGVYAHALTISQMPPHNHQLSGFVSGYRQVSSPPNGAPSGIDSGGGGADVGLWNIKPFASSSGSGQLHNNLHPVLGINFIIRVLL